jgi:hypothetical protein
MKKKNRLIFRFNREGNFSPARVVSKAFMIMLVCFLSFSTPGYANRIGLAGAAVDGILEAANSQEVTVRGKVTDAESGDPLQELPYW